jgi:MoaA/NifB/PqqE/SkfB family radical SAM enzyme
MKDLIGSAARFWRGGFNYLIFQVTSRCNAACEHCFNWRNTQEARRLHDRELTLNEIEMITRKLPPMLLVNLCGGEPTLRDDLPEIVRLFSRDCSTRFITIPTNGFLPRKTEDVFGRIFRENPDTFFRLGVSLDGWEEEHDRIRRHPGGFRKTMETAGILRGMKRRYSNYFVEANIVFSTATQDRVEELVDNIRSTGLFDSIAVLYIRGDPRDPELMRPDLEKYRSINRRILDEFRVSRHPSSRILEALTELVVDKVIEVETTGRQCYRCFAADRLAVLNARGELFPCEIIADSLIGNVRDWDYDIPRMLESPGGVKWREHAGSCVCTWECAINMSFIYQPLQSLKVVARGMLNILR